jgi:uncharacterized repeat protein (TIGR03803 family)
MLGSMPAAAGAHEFKSLYSFKAGSDGAAPYSPLLLGADGNFYGTTNAGGKAGAGTVFKMTPDGKETVLYAFADTPDGAGPGGSGVVADTHGNLYGTTTQGGTFDGGTIYRISPAGGETILHSFTGGSDGSFPNATLITDGLGNFYGTANTGGARNEGVVFRYSANGVFKLLHSFTGGHDGAAPEGMLLRDATGNLFGTTFGGGSKSKGTVYKIAANGHPSILHAFTGSSDGANPYAGVIEDSAGNLYGTASLGGGEGFGTVYRLAPGGSLTVLHTFKGGTDGQYPYGGLVADASGNLYGTTKNGGVLHGAGTLFQITPTRHESVWHTFLVSDGDNPTDGLIAAPEGSTVALYGTTVYGGTNNGGTVFKLNE